MMTRIVGLIVVFVATCCTSGEVAAGSGKASSNDPVLRWNAVALKADAEDHSGTYSPVPEQRGPVRAARALAIVHIAIFDAANAVLGSPYESYFPLAIDSQTLEKASLDAAVAQAAHDALCALYPSQKEVFDAELAKALKGIPVKKGRNEGVAVGAATAVNILWWRGELGGPDDGSRSPLNESDAYLPKFPPEDFPGFHQVDPLNPHQGFYAPGWGMVATFSGIDVQQSPYLLPAPPALSSPEYTAAFEQVALYGGDGVITPTLRTAEETGIGLFWAYDGTKGLGTPVRLFNQMVAVVAKQERNTVAENARLFALVNIAMADGGIAAWHNKYVYEFWRPVVAIRAPDDENADTVQDETWTPLGAPASNGSGLNFTPPFPAYPSGHATFGAATCRILERFYGTDDVPLSLRSDEMNPHTTDADGDRRPLVIRRFSTFTEAALENAASRIYLGVHWNFDATSGMELGQAVGDHVFASLLRPAGE